MNQSLNETLRQSRKAKGYTQEQLAQLLHVSRQTISNWETGRASPDYELLKQLSALLGVEEESPAAHGAAGGTGCGGKPPGTAPCTQKASAVAGADLRVCAAGRADGLSIDPA